MGKTIQWFALSIVSLFLAIVWILRMPAIRAVEAVVLISLSFASGVYCVKAINSLRKSKS